jgi:uncharacterized membrane protein
MADLTDADKQYRHSHSQHLRDEDHLRIARRVAKAVTDAELDRLVERNNRYIASLRGENELKCGNGMASFALEESTTAITAMRARIAELEQRLEIDPAQPYDGIETRDATIIALETYKENLRDEVVELRAKIAELEAERAEWVGEREESIRRGARRTPGRFRL